MSPPARRARPAPEEQAGQAGLRRKLYRVQAAALLDPPDGELIGFLAED